MIQSSGCSAINVESLDGTYIGNFVLIVIEYRWRKPKVRRKTLKKILIGLYSGILIFTACAPTVTPVFIMQEASATSSPIPTSTNTYLPTETPMFDELVQPNPFPTTTPNPTAEAIAKRWNLDTVLLSPDGNWAAASAPGIMHIIQMQGNNELSVKCETFAVCEFVVPVQWSPDSRMLYFAPLLTGESNIPFRQYTGIARIDIITGKFEKMVENSPAEREYSMSLSPDGNYLAFTEGRRTTSKPCDS